MIVLIGDPSAGYQQATAYARETGSFLVQAQISPTIT